MTPLTNPRFVKQSAQLKGESQQGAVINSTGDLLEYQKADC